MTNNELVGLTGDQVFRLGQSAFEKGYAFGVKETVEQFEMMISKLKSDNQEIFGDEE